MNVQLILPWEAPVGQIGLHLVAGLQTNINNEKALRAAASRVTEQLPGGISSATAAVVLTALWQTPSMAVLRSRPILIRQCNVRPLRCRPEQWVSISARQCSTISGLREKSSISIRR